MQAIDVAVELPSGTGDAEYLAAVRSALEQGFQKCPGGRPDLVIYNAGTDVLKGDPLGRLCVTAAAVQERDEMVWRAAQRAGSPLVMMLSGGYTAASTPCIAASLANLFDKFQLGSSGASGPPAGSSAPGAGAAEAGAEL